MNIGPEKSAEINVRKGLALPNTPFSFVNAHPAPAQISSTDISLNNAWDVAMTLVECARTPAGKANHLILYTIQIASKIQCKLYRHPIYQVSKEF